jgi:pimeloyl-ACP methyl ester carboxylesterase
MTRIAAPLDSEPYDEFGMLAENAAELGLDLANPPAVARRSVSAAPEQEVSAIIWGDTEPQLVFLHGGGQNAHTWDSVILALGVPAVAVDLPGHGHSDRRVDRNYGPWRNSDAMAAVIEELAPDALAVVGMSLGGATTICFAATRPDLVRRAVIIDVTPQVNDPGRAMTPEHRGSVALLEGPPSYASFEEAHAATLALSPKRTQSAVRRGVRHNMVRLPDGRWAWRYDLFGPRTGPDVGWGDFTPLWEDVTAIVVPTMVVQGGDSAYVLPEDRAEFERRLPTVCWAVVDGAGHAVQSDQPLALAELIREFALRG